MNVQIFSTLAGMEMKDWILAARTHAKLTQPQLGEALGLTKGNISAWENGRHEASHEQLVRIAAVTGYAEPLPGMSQPISTASAPWPFKKISLQKVEAMRATDLAQLEAAIIGSAIALNLDVKKDA